MLANGAARTGTPLSQVETALAERGQMLAFEPVDYGPMLGGEGAQASVGGVFATASKHNPERPIGLDGMRGLMKQLPRLPVCAIAGIGHGNAASVIAAGADGVAVISDIFMADDVAAATRRLREIVDAAIAQRSPA